MVRSAHMRVLFISHTLESTAGVSFKVVSSAAEWERQGHQVWLASTRDPTPRRVAEVEASLREPPRARGLRERIAGELAFRLFHPRAFRELCARLQIDVVYCRDLPWTPGLRGLVAERPFVHEVNGDPALEIASPLLRRARVQARRALLQHADGLVFVSRELCRQSEPCVSRRLILANACLPVALPDAARQPPARPTVVLIGYARQTWSGIDKLPALAAALPEFDFVLIGAQLVGPPNLRSLGTLTQREADRVMLACTVGLGPLALHRKGMFEASPLKSRNYLALGLPLIAAYEDTDLSERDGCVLQIPNSEENTQMAVAPIRDFVWRAHREPELSQQARALAHGRLSLAAKEQQRLQFLQACASR